MKIRPVGAELFHADGQTYMAKLIVAFRNFANSPKNIQLDVGQHRSLKLISLQNA